MKKSSRRGGPCGRPARAGATIRQPTDCPHGATAKRDSFTASDGKDGAAFPMIDYWHETSEAVSFGMRERRLERGDPLHPRI